MTGKTASPGYSRIQAGPSYLAHSRILSSMVSWRQLVWGNFLHISALVKLVLFYVSGGVSSLFTDAASVINFMGLIREDVRLLRTYEFDIQILEQI